MVEGSVHLGCLNASCTATLMALKLEQVLLMRPTATGLGLA
jgi:hypothetical protein